MLHLRVEHKHGEFDPGSELTLAARLKHASGTVRLLREYTSRERVSNTWVICLEVGDTPGKPGIIPDVDHFSQDGWSEVGDRKT